MHTTMLMPFLAESFSLNTTLLKSAIHTGLINISTVATATGILSIETPYETKPTL